MKGLKFLTIALMFFGMGTMSAQVDSTNVEKTVKVKTTKKHELTGKATFYGTTYTSRRKTASGEYFNKDLMTAAHKTLPFGAMVKVTNTKNQKSVVVRINDRGPYAKGKVIDLSPAAFKKIGDLRQGVLPIKIEIL